MWNKSGWNTGMKKHVRIFYEYYNLACGDFIPCAICKSSHADIHHIDPKGMGGRAGKDTIDNLIPLCRQCHIDAHRSIISKEELLERMEILGDIIDSYRFGNA
jgi:5-methylcytosine-specific restriction endonuclease McrA